MKQTLYHLSLGCLIFGLASILAESLWPGIVSLTYDNRLWFLLSLILWLYSHKFRIQHS